MSSPEPATPLYLGQVVTIIAQDGKVLEGRIARADLMHRATGAAGPWVLFMTPLADEQGGQGADPGRRVGG